MHGIFLNYLDGLTATLRSEAELSDPSGENLVVHFLAKEGKNGPKMTIFKIYEKLTTKFTFPYIHLHTSATNNNSNNQFNKLSIIQFHSL